MNRLLPALAVVLSGSASLFSQDIVLPDGKAKGIIEQTCAECHGLEEIVSNPMSRENWQKTVASMIKKGASLDPSQIGTVVDYLSVYFSPDKVNVNTATAKEMQAALGLTEAEAKAVVELRAKGKIENAEALAKASGLDAKKIDANKDLISF